MSETIGKVTLDTRFYPDADRYSDGDETEDRLLEIVTGTSEEDYPAVIAREGSWPILYHLSPIRENILNWTGIRKGDRVLELGAGCGAVTGALLKKGAKVTSVDLSLRRSRINAQRHKDSDNLEILVGAMEDVLPEMKGQYDHVTLIGVLEYAACFSNQPEPFRHMLRAAAGALKDGGSLWVAIENRLGMKYFAGSREDHTGRFFEGIEGYPHRDGPCTFSRSELEELAGACGLECRFHYPYPDYKFPVKIFTDEYLPKKGELTRNWQTFDADRVTTFDEGAAFDAAIGEGVFPLFANSFLAEMRKKETRGENGGSGRTIYAKASVERRKAFRQLTLIREENGERVVRKAAENPEAEEHLKGYRRNYEVLAAAMKPGSRIRPIPCEEREDGSVTFPFLTGRTLTDRLNGADEETYIRETTAFRDALKEAFGTEPFTAGEAFRKIFPEAGLPEGLEALGVTNLDMNFDNVFPEEDGGYALIDYEWTLPFPVPLAYILYRSLLSDPAYARFGEDARERIRNALGMGGIPEENLFAMEMGFQRYAAADEDKLDYFSPKGGKALAKTESLGDLLQEKEQLKTDLLEYKTAYDQQQEAIRTLEGERDQYHAAFDEYREAYRKQEGMLAEKQQELEKTAKAFEEYRQEIAGLWWYRAFYRNRKEENA